MANDKDTNLGTFDVILTAAGEGKDIASDAIDAATNGIKLAVKNVLDTSFPGGDFQVEVILEPQQPEPTPEQRAAVQAYADKLGEETEQRYVTAVKAEQAIVHARDYAIAEKWAAKPGLTERERCHGVVWDIHRQTDALEKDKHDKIAAGSDVYKTIMPTPIASAPGYAELYERSNVEQIKDGLVRSASDLFS